MAFYGIFEYFAKHLCFTLIIFFMEKDSNVITNITRVDTDRVVSVVCLDKQNHEVLVTKEFVKSGKVFRSEEHRFSLKTLPLELALELATAILKVTECVDYGK